VPPAAGNAVRIHRRQGDAGVLPETIPAILRRVYANRGIREAESVDLNLGGLLPFQPLRGIEAATERLDAAIQANQHILVVGDYDADGATATALALAGLQSLGAQRVSYLIPDRFEHGYGLSPAIVDLAAARRPDLILTVDNGIASVEGVARATSLGLPVIVTDHHLPGDRLPEAVAIVNPNQPGCEFAGKHLAGVGVMFYVLAALRARRLASGCIDPDKARLADLLDLVALGTVADLVPLDRNNRILVAQGLRRLRAGRGRPGIVALARVAGRTLDRLSETDIGFALAPRLNAAGRMDSMTLGVECLLAPDEQTALALAAELDGLNRDRRQRQGRMESQAQAQMERWLAAAEDEDPLGYCLFDADWHEGIVGLVAGRLKERTHRPAVAFARSGDGRLKGSVRSIPGVHARDVLANIARARPELLPRFGGHAMAAGLSIPDAQLDAFRRAWLGELERWMSDAVRERRLDSDGPLTSAHLTVETAGVLENGGPWGQGFPPPSFDEQFELIDQRIVGDAHLKMRLCPVDGGPIIDAIMFRRDQLLPEGRPLHCVYRAELNRYQGREQLQLVVEHVQPAGAC
jgi:single-stranded-DNA-specific exonuclease